MAFSSQLLGEETKEEKNLLPNYIPPQVDFTQFTGNGTTLSDEKRNAYTKWLEEKKPDYYSHPEESVQLSKESAKVIHYKADKLGEGGFGAAYLLAPFTANNCYKVTKICSALSKEAANKEQQIWHSLGQSAHVTSSTDFPGICLDQNQKPHPCQYTAITMDYAKGVDLRKLLEFRNDPHRPESKWTHLIWLDIADKCIEAILKLRNHGLNYIDIKLNNFMYDIATQTLSIVDMGEVFSLDHVDEQRYGTVAYMPPERKRNFATYSYTEKGQTYSLGILLQELLFNQDAQADGLWGMIIPPRFYNRSRRSPFYNDRTAKQKIKDVLHEMRLDFSLEESRSISDSDLFKRVEQRLSLSEAQKKIIAIREQYAALHPDTDKETNNIYTQAKKDEQMRMISIRRFALDPRLKELTFNKQDKTKDLQLILDYIKKYCTDEKSVAAFRVYLLQSPFDYLREKVGRFKISFWYRLDKANKIVPTTSTWAQIEKALHQQQKKVVGSEEENRREAQSNSSRMTIS